MCRNLLGMKSTLARKITTKFLFFYFGIFLFFSYFILFVTFFQPCQLISHSQKVATHCTEQNKKRIMTTLVKKQKSY